MAEPVQQTTGSTGTASNKAAGPGDAAKGGPYTGAVDMKSPGTMEAALLAARAMTTLAGKVAAAVHAALKKRAAGAGAAIPGRQDGHGWRLCLFGAKDLPSFRELSAFTARCSILEAAFKDEISRPRPEGAGRGSSSEAVAESLVVSGAAALAGLDVVSKLLGYFKSDYQLGGVDVQLEEAALLFPVAGALAELGHVVSMPALYAPATTSVGVKGVADQLAPLFALAGAAAGEAGELRKAAEKAQAGDAIQKAKADEDRARAKRLEALVSSFDGFLTALAAPATTGIAPLSAIAEQLAQLRSLADGPVLIVRLESKGGSSYVEKSLWSGLGDSIPVHHSGGATASYLLLDGRSGAVVTGGVIPVHGGFVATLDLERVLMSP